jgi:hypothetical protein
MGFLGLLLFYSNLFLDIFRSFSASHLFFDENFCVSHSCVDDCQRYGLEWWSKYIKCKHILLFFRHLVPRSVFTSSFSYFTAFCLQIVWFFFLLYVNDCVFIFICVWHF